MIAEDNNDAAENGEQEDMADLDIINDGEDDLEAQMAATMAAEGLDDMLGDDDDLEAQMAAAMAADASDDSNEGDLEAQMAAAMAAEGENIDEGVFEGLSGDFSDEGDDEDISVKPLEFPQLRPSDETVQKENVDRLMDVSLSVSVELGRKQMQIKEILDLGPGKIIELDKLAGEPVDLLVNGKLLAKGEVVVVDENFGVRITDLITPKDRIRSL